jgi:hypothetical protein
MPRSSRAALQVVRDVEPPAEGDPEVRKEKLAEWSEGQAECRAERHHRYRPIQTFVYYGRKVDWENIPIGTRLLIIEECSRCKSVRHSADFMTTQRGLRQLTKWKPEYRDHKGIAYLLSKGAGRLDDGDMEELRSRKYLRPQRRLNFVADEDEERGHGETH